MSRLLLKSKTSGRSISRTKEEAVGDEPPVKKKRTKLGIPSPKSAKNTVMSRRLDRNSEIDGSPNIKGQEEQATVEGLKLDSKTETSYSEEKVLVQEAKSCHVTDSFKSSDTALESHGTAGIKPTCDVPNISEQNIIGPKL